MLNEKKKAATFQKLQCILGLVSLIKQPRILFYIKNNHLKKHFKMMNFCKIFNFQWALKVISTWFFLYLLRQKKNGTFSTVLWINSNLSNIHVPSFMKQIVLDLFDNYKLIVYWKWNSFFCDGSNGELFLFLYRTWKGGNF